MTASVSQARLSPREAAPRLFALSVLIVTHNHSELVRACLGSLLAQLGRQDEIIVLDNNSSDGTPDVVEEIAPSARVLRRRTNLGFAAGCNAACAQARGDLFVLLNPDTVVVPGFVEAITRPLSDGRGWTAWQSLITQAGGQEINTSGGTTHFVGLSWATQIGEPLTALAPGSREVAFASGACLAVPRTVWELERGFSEEFFLYFEDVDLSLRLRLAGGVVGIETTARVDHIYHFSRGPQKWRLLERNRWATIIRTYPPGLLLLLGPALALTELAILAIATRAGWGVQKRRAMLDVARALPRLLRERREIQSRRTISSARFASYLTSELTSPFLGAGSDSRVLRAGLTAYWTAVRAVLARGRR